VSNIDDKDKLKAMPLKIGEHTATYWAFFKKIEYLQDNKGLIYWGRIKAIKDYTNSFRIDFERRYGSTKALLGQRLPEQETHRQLPQAQGIPGADQGGSQQRPALILLLLWRDAGAEAGAQQENPEQTFGVFSANIENLDHLIIREAPGLG
jgi:hypothetical protein